MKETNDVVITGIGILAPNGIGLDAFWNSILAGRSGIGPIPTTSSSPSSRPTGWRGTPSSPSRPP
jgi:3-oxoacyl-(acyl-carrier-protein) synthase